VFAPCAIETVLNFPTFWVNEAVNLEALVVRNHIDINSLSALRATPKLQHLDISGLSVTDLAPLRA